MRISFINLSAIVQASIPAKHIIEQLALHNTSKASKQQMRQAAGQGHHEAADNAPMASSEKGGIHPDVLYTAVHKVILTTTCWSAEAVSAVVKLQGACSRMLSSVNEKLHAQIYPGGLGKSAHATSP